MPLDPQVKGVLDAMEALGAPPLHTLPVVDARKSMEGFLELAGPSEAVAHVDNRNVPGPLGDIPVRIYTPEGEGPFPILVYYHGGGWVIGDLEIYDPTCRRITNGARCIVVSVDYRLAPENKFPAAAEDCYAATAWVAENAASLNGDPTRVAVGGDSAGGNLTAVVSLMARDRGGPHIIYQWAMYPVTEHFSVGRPSYEENADGYLLTRDAMIWFWNHYAEHETDYKHTYASPMLASDLHGLPPALVVTAEYDPLRDEGEAYAARLKEEGVPVTARRFDGLIHGFIMFGVIDAARQATDYAIGELRKALYP